MKFDAGLVPFEGIVDGQTRVSIDIIFGNSEGDEIGAGSVAMSDLSGDANFEIAADYSDLASPTVYVEVRSAGQTIAAFEGHGYDIGLCSSLPIGAGAAGDWRPPIDDPCQRAAFEQGTVFTIDGADYIGDELIVGPEGGRTLIELLVVVSVTASHLDSITLTDIVAEPVPGCLADLNGDGNLNVFDFLSFQTAFSDEEPTAELAAPAGVFNVFDFLFFQTAFSEGC